jgi:hypothetical protein
VAFGRVNISFLLLVLFEQGASSSCLFFFPGPAAVRVRVSQPGAARLVAGCTRRETLDKHTQAS